MLRVIAINQVLHDGTTLEYPNGLSIGKHVCQTWNPTIWVDVVEKPLLFLSAMTTVSQCFRVSGQPPCFLDMSILVHSYLRPNSSKVICGRSVIVLDTKPSTVHTEILIPLGV